MNLQRREWRAQFVRRIRNESPLSLQQSAEPREQQIDRAHEGDDFGGHVVERNRVVGGGVPRGDRDGQAIEPGHDPVDDPVQRQQRQRNKDRDRKRCLKRCVGRQLLPDAHRLRNLNSSIRRSQRVDAPFVIGRRNVGQPGRLLPRDINGGQRLPKRPAGRIPDLDDEVVLRIVRNAANRAIHWHGRRIPDIERDLPKLIVEEVGRLVPGEEVGRRRRADADNRHQSSEPHESRASDRDHAFHLGIIQPAPRTLRMMSLSNLRRT